MESQEKNKAQTPMSIDEMIAMVRKIGRTLRNANSHDSVDIKRLKLLQDCCTYAKNVAGNYLGWAVTCQAQFQEDEYVDYNGVLHIVTGIVFSGGDIKYALKKVDAHRFDTSGRPFKVLAGSIKAADDNDYAWNWESRSWLLKQKTPTAASPA